MPQSDPRPTSGRRAPWGLVFPAALASALLLALLTTEGRMGDPPPLLGLLGLGAAVALCAGCAVAAPRGGRWLRIAVVAALTALALAAGQEALRPGCSRGHDLFQHLWGLWSTWRCVLDGDPIPRWNPYLGTGIPLLQFYSPLSFLVAAPAQALGASPVTALRWLILVSQLAGALSAYGATRWLGASRAASLVAAGLMALAPYHLLDQNVRTAMAELLAFPWLPPLFAAGFRVGRGHRGSSAWILLVCLAGLLLTHVLTLYMALLGLIPLALAGWLGAGGGRRPALGRLAGASAAAAGVTAWWWLPLITEIGHTSAGRVFYDADAMIGQAVFPWEPVHRRMWEGFAYRDPAGDATAVPMYFGCVALVLLVLAMVRPGRGADPAPATRRIEPRLWALVAVAFLLLALRGPVHLLWQLPGAGSLQFPWRLYGPATVLAAIAAAGAVDAWAARGLLSAGPRRTAGILATAALIALAVDAAPYLGSAERLSGYEGRGLVHWTTSGLETVDIPRDRFVRLEEAWLPPSDYDWQVGLLRRAYAEYLPPALWKDFASHWLLPPGDVEQSQFLGASWRLARGAAAPIPLDPQPFAALLPPAATGAAPQALDWERTPERILVDLPEGHGGGTLRVAESWFPGWRARVDGGDWTVPAPPGLILATEVAPGARRVELRYGWLRPWDRPVGAAISVVTALLLLGIGWRFRRRTAA